uniref:XPG-I domain-containing protein n=1 Tax=Hyaloperonospora arabidopsidis (strain Emoy2) TaxID=559515 RepID=M4BBA1_HYAAE
MGVRGLSRFCRQKEVQTSTETSDLHDVTLAVDFVGFLYYLCDELFRESNASPAWLLLGGCTLRLERYVEKWLTRLEARRVRLVFVTDPPQCFGGESHRKGLCLQDRRLQKAQQIEQVTHCPEWSLPRSSSNSDSSRSSTTDGRSSLLAKTLLQTNGRFPFAREKLRGVLMSHGIPITTASREADEELGAMVRSGAAFAVLAEDSDFLVMTGVKYIPFDKLQFYEDELCPEHLKMRARVFSSDLVAQALGLQVEQLVDLALLCGNDFTPVLDEVFDMAAMLGYPVQRLQASSSLYPATAARWVVEHLPTLENPFLIQIEAKKKGFLHALFEIYRFYGHEKAFLEKFPMKIRSIIPNKKMKQYKTLIDRFDYPQMAIDILETKSHGLSQRFDPLAWIPGLEGKSLDELQAPARCLTYVALDALVVQEMAFDHTVEVRVEPLDSLRPLLSIPLQQRSAKAVDRILRSLVFSLVYGDPTGGSPEAANLAGMLGKTDKKGLAVKNIVYGLLALWKRDRTYLAGASLLDDRLLELLLLSSLISLAIDTSKLKPKPRSVVMFDEHLLSMEVYAVVSAYLGILKQFHQLRLVIGNKLPTKLGCATYFSCEVFMQVCQLMLQHSGTASMTPKSPNVVPEFARHEIEPLMNFYTEISSDRFWRHYKAIRTMIQRMKALIVLPADAVHTSVNNRSLAALALERAMTKRDSINSDSSEVPLVVAPPVPPAGFFPPLPRDLPSQLHTPALTPVDFVPPLPRDSPSQLDVPALATSARPLANAKPASHFTSPRPPTTSMNLQASAPAFSYRLVKGLMPSSVAKCLGVGSAVHQNAGSVREAEPKAKKPVSLKGLMKTLPVYGHRKEILDNVVENQLTIIQGETGCGKSTSVPQFLYDSWARDRATSERPVNIYVTQPRRIAAIELAGTVARMRDGNEFGEDGQVGKVIGYRIGQKQVTSSETKITCAEKYDAPSARRST